MTAFITILAVELDTGTVFLADRAGSLGSDVLTPALLETSEVSTDGFSAQIERQALPGWAPREWWINREVMLIEVGDDAGSVYDGTPVFDGVIAAQPAESAGVWSLSIIAPKRRVRPVPDYGIVSADEWPTASPVAMGKAKPLIVGTVDRCPLLPVAVPASSTLSVAAAPGDGQLEVGDASVFGAAGTVVVDGVTYAYTGKSGNLLLGVPVTARHASGTLVSQAGNHVYLAAGHAVSSISDVRAGDALVEGAGVNLSAATVTFQSPPRVAASSTRYALDMHFDEVASGNTAGNPANAIRAAINTYSQSGTASGPVISSAPGTVDFSRPVDGNRIIAGSYTIQFAVSVGAQVGRASVSIGREVVWVYMPGVGVVYNNSPAAITFDDDGDSLPVTVDVEEGGSPDEVTVSVVAANRIIVTGNLDEANFATVAPGQILKVKQTTANPDRGRIAQSRLLVRWFATDAALGTTTVKLGGQTLGALKITPNSATSLTRTITADVTSQGAASLPQLAVSTSVAGGTASLSHATVPVYQRVVPSYAVTYQGGVTYRFFSSVYVASLFQNQSGAITIEITWQMGANEIVNSVTVGFKRSNGTLIDWFVPPNRIGLWDGTVTTITSRHTLTESPSYVEFTSSGFGQTADANKATRPIDVSFRFTAYVTQAAVLSNTPASGSSSPISARSLSHSGTTVTISGGNINFSVPAPPRVVDTYFDLPTYVAWSDFTDAAMEISLTGTGASLCIVEARFEVEYDEIVWAAAESVTATVTGQSGNPADVIAMLAGATGESLDIAARTRLAAWCSAVGLSFSRRIDSPTDALQLLAFAAEQAGVHLARRAEYLWPVRWGDLAENILQISDGDLLSSAEIGWVERTENAITLRYAEDYAGNAGFTRVAQALAANNSTCAASVRAILETRPVEIDGGWLRDDTSAAVALSALVGRNAMPHRTVRMALPYAFEVEDGGLIEYADAVWRIVAIDKETGGWPVVDAEEVLS